MMTTEKKQNFNRPTTADDNIKLAVSSSKNYIEFGWYELTVFSIETITVIGFSTITVFRSTIDFCCCRFRNLKITKHYDHP